jgi:hypothetical protein
VLGHFLIESGFEHRLAPSSPSIAQRVSAVNTFFISTVWKCEPGVGGEGATNVMVNTFG